MRESFSNVAHYRFSDAILVLNNVREFPFELLFKPLQPILE